MRITNSERIFTNSKGGMYIPTMVVNKLTLSLGRSPVGDYGARSSVAATHAVAKPSWIILWEISCFRYCAGDENLGDSCWYNMLGVDFRRHLGPDFCCWILDVKHFQMWVLFLDGGETTDPICDVARSSWVLLYVLHFLRGLQSLEICKVPACIWVWLTNEYKRWQTPEYIYIYRLQTAFGVSHHCNRISLKPFIKLQIINHQSNS